jgi:hypothetical protein
MFSILRVRAFTSFPNIFNFATAQAQTHLLHSLEQCPHHCDLRPHLPPHSIPSTSQPSSFKHPCDRRRETGLLRAHLLRQPTTLPTTTNTSNTLRLRRHGRKTQRRRVKSRQVCLQYQPSPAQTLTFLALSFPKRSLPSYVAASVISWQ